jgi:hypothetical protein
MNQLDIAAMVVDGTAEWTWVPLGSGIEVMAWPAMVGDLFLAVSARTASCCAAAISRNGWIVSLTTPKLEDWIYERSALHVEPIYLDPQHIDIASAGAVAKHSQKLLGRIGLAPRHALVSCGKSWVLSNELLARPGHAASYGSFSRAAPYRSATGAHALWQPLSFTHDLDYWDYSQLLRLVRRRPGTTLPSYDAPLRVVELVRATTPPPAGQIGSHSGLSSHEPEIRR